MCCNVRLSFPFPHSFEANTGTVEDIEGRNRSKDQDHWVSGTTVERARRSPWFWSWRPNSRADWSQQPGERPCCMLPGDVCVLVERERKGGHLGNAYWTAWWYWPIRTCQEGENCPSLVLLTPIDGASIVFLLHVVYTLIHICENCPSLVILTAWIVLFSFYMLLYIRQYHQFTYVSFTLW